MSAGDFIAWGAALFVCSVGLIAFVCLLLVLRTSWQDRGGRRGGHRGE